MFLVLVCPRVRIPFLVLSMANKLAHSSSMLVEHVPKNFFSVSREQTIGLKFKDLI